jgi:hypothetical protein
MIATSFKQALRKRVASSSVLILAIQVLAAIIIEAGIAGLA